MRRTRIVAGAVTLLLLLVAGAVFVVSRNADNYRGQVQAVLAKRLGRAVSLGQLNLSLVPFGLRVERAAIADDPSFHAARPFAQVDELYVRPRLLPLLRGRFELASVELREPAIELVRNAEGVWNVTTLGRGATGTSDAALVLDRLVITGGQLAVTDLQTRRKTPASAADQGGRAVYRNIDVEVDGYAPGTAFGIGLAATLPGPGTERLSVRGTAGPLVQEDIARTPFSGVLRFDKASISGLLTFLDAEALEGTDAVVSGSADVRSSGGQLSSKGSLQFTDTRVRGEDLGYPITATFEIAHDTSVGLLTIASSSVRLDRTPISLDGTVNLEPDTPVLDVHLTASNASLAETARLASAFGVAFGSGMQVSGNLHADVRARGAVDQPTLEGQLRLRDVSISGADVPRPVEVQALDLVLTPNEIRSNDFTATTNGTSLDARVTLGGYAAPAPTVDASLRATDADFGDVLNIARAWGAQAVDGVSGTGRLSLNVRASGPLSAPRYSGTGSLVEATLKTPAIAESLRVRSAGMSFSMNAASFENLTMSLGKTTATGSLTVRDFAAPTVRFDLSADSIDVVEMQAMVAPAGDARPTVAGKAPAAQVKDGESALLRMQGSGRIRVGSIANEQLVLEDVQAAVTIDRGLTRLDPLTAAVYGGRHGGSIALDARRTPATFTYTSTLERVDANRLASATTSLRDVIFGALSSDVRISASAGGAQEIAKSLNGTLSLNLPDGRIANMDLLHEISNVGRFLTGRAVAERSTSVAALTGTFTVTNGLARTEDLKATIDGGTLGASGSINLVDQRVDLRLTAVLSKEFSQRAGGTRVGGFLTTALANQQGELVVPLRMTGTMQQPRFAPDAQRVAEMKLRNLVPSLRNPQQLTTGILDAIAGRKEDGPAPREPVRQLQDRLRGLLGGAKKEEPKAPPPEEKPQ
jgi:uncharacterized protein involved in outer membrane biogenesis